MAVGLRHLAAASAFIIATKTAVQHANAQSSYLDCDDNVGLVFTCGECLPRADVRAHMFPARVIPEQTIYVGLIVCG